MRFHWLAVALKFVLLAVVVKLVLVLVLLLTLPFWAWRETGTIDAPRS